MQASANLSAWGSSVARERSMMADCSLGANRRAPELSRRICRSRRRDVLPDIGEHRLVQTSWEVRQQQAKRGGGGDRVQQYKGLTGRVCQIQARTGLGERAERVLDRLRLGRAVDGFRELAAMRLHHAAEDLSRLARPRLAAQEPRDPSESLAEMERARETWRA